MLRATLTALVVAAVVLTVACSGENDNGGFTAYGDTMIVYEARSQNSVNVYTIDPATAESKQLTFGTAFDGHPAWAAETGRIIFVSDRESPAGARDIYTMRSDGSDQQRLTNTPTESEWTPKYSPDGTQIAFVVQGEGGYTLNLMNANGSSRRKLAGPYDFIEFPAWRRDGSEIWFAAIAEGTQGSDLLSLDLKSGEIRTRVSTPGADVCPHFMRDGKSMTYATSPGAPNEPPDIFMRDLGNEDPGKAADKRVTSNPARDDYAYPSPDGSRFVFVTNRDGNMELYLMNADGSDQKPLTRTPGVDENVPDW